MPGKQGKASLPLKVGVKVKGRGKASANIGKGIKIASGVQTTKKFTPGSDNNLASSVFER